MSRNPFVVLAIAASWLCTGIAAEARAQETMRPELFAAALQLPGTNLSVTTLTVPPVQVEFRPLIEPQPSNLLRSLYVTTATMQALDVHSTFAALNRGGSEVNPMMDGLTKHRVAFGAVKAGVAASSIYAAHRLAKHNRVAAIALLIAINSAYAVVVSHNYKVANRMGR